MTRLAFGVRSVNTGRTVVFKMARWQDAVIDLEPVQASDQNREKVRANLAVVVGVGRPDEPAKVFVESHNLQLLLGPELKQLLKNTNPPGKSV